MKRLIHNIRMKLGLYDLRKEGAKWVAFIVSAIHEVIEDGEKSD